ncbi:MAG: nicotinate-nucleotide adenylyltransferase [Nitrospiraceae bacterium]|nr:nicotinate-nucleotide adenylyltransferase [Nitrospiraceae bacterium]
MGKRGIFGGTFNPIHLAHLRAAEEAREALGLEKVVFVPAGTPPLKNTGAQLAPVSERLRMVELAIKGNPFFELSDVECREGKKSSPSYTVNTLEELKLSHPEDDLVFITGMDVFMELHLWWRPERLIELADFAVLSRPGWSFGSIMDSPYIDGPEGLRAGLSELDGKGRGVFSLRLKSGRGLHLVRIRDMEIAARDIRSLVKRGGSIRYLLPEAVESFIISYKLYL